MTVEGGRSKRRPGLFLDMNSSHTVIVEVEESCHDLYDPTPAKRTAWGEFGTMWTIVQLYLFGSIRQIQRQRCATPFHHHGMGTVLMVKPATVSKKM